MTDRFPFVADSSRARNLDFTTAVSTGDPFPFDRPQLVCQELGQYPLSYGAPSATTWLLEKVLYKVRLDTGTLCMIDTGGPPGLSSTPTQMGSLGNWGEFTARYTGFYDIQAELAFFPHWGPQFSTNSADTPARLVRVLDGNSQPIYVPADNPRNDAYAHAFLGYSNLETPYAQTLVDSSANTDSTQRMLQRTELYDAMLTFAEGRKLSLLKGILATGHSGQPQKYLDDVRAADTKKGATTPIWTVVMGTSGTTKSRISKHWTNPDTVESGRIDVIHLSQRVFLRAGTAVAVYASFESDLTETHDKLSRFNLNTARSYLQAHFLGPL